MIIAAIIILIGLFLLIAAICDLKDRPNIRFTKSSRALKKKYDY